MPIRLKRNTKNLYYCGKALAWHKADRERMKYGYIAKWSFNCGRYGARKDYSKNNNGFVCYFGIPRYLFKEITKDLFSLIVNLHKQREFIKAWKKIFMKLGGIWEYIRFYKNANGKCNHSNL